MARRAAETVGFAAAPAEEIALAVDECRDQRHRARLRRRAGPRVRVRFTCGEGQIVIEVVDDGAGLDAGALPAVDLKRYAHERRNGGLGVHLMAKIMDSVTYSKEGRFNVCRLERSLQSVKHPG